MVYSRCPSLCVWGGDATLLSYRHALATVESSGFGYRKPKSVREGQRQQAGENPYLDDAI